MKGYSVFIFPCFIFHWRRDKFHDHFSIFTFIILILTIKKRKRRVRTPIHSITRNRQDEVLNHNPNSTQANSARQPHSPSCRVTRKGNFFFQQISTHTSNPKSLPLAIALMDVMEGMCSPLELLVDWKEGI